MNPVSGGAITGQWDPIAALQLLVCAADNQVSTQSALLSEDPQTDVTPVDFATDTTGTPIGIDSAFSGLSLPVLGGFADDGATGRVRRPVKPFYEVSLCPKLPSEKGAVVITEALPGPTTVNVP